MRFSCLTDAIWVASVISNGVLLIVLCIRGRWRSFPVFTGLTVFEIIRSMILFVAASRGNPYAYSWAYWITEALDISLEIAVLWELTNMVLVQATNRPSLPKTESFGKITIVLAITLAAGFSALLHGSGTKTHIVDMHASVFTSLLTCELYLLFSGYANRLGFRRKQHIMAISNGLAVVCAVSLLVDTIHQLVGWDPNHVPYDQAKSAVIVAVLLYWTRSLWFAEGPAPGLWPSLAHGGPSHSLIHNALLNAEQSRRR